MLELKPPSSRSGFVVREKAFKLSPTRRTNHEGTPNGVQYNSRGSGDPRLLFAEEMLDPR
jgi:hypothetical protein